MLAAGFKGSLALGVASLLGIDGRGILLGTLGSLLCVLGCLALVCCHAVQLL
jgi:hypothetical protein